MGKKILVHVSSATGNTRKVADFVINMLKKEGHDVEEFDSNKLVSCDFVLLFFWCRKSSLDDKSNKLVSSLTGTKIMAIGTLGGRDDGPYAKRVKGNVREEINKKNICLDVFLCRGKVNLNRTWERARLPVTAPHHLDEEGVKRHLESQSHPDSRDLLAAAEFALEGAKRVC